MKLRLKVASTLVAGSLSLVGTAAYGADAAVAELGQGVALWSAGNYQAAIPHLRASQEVKKLADYSTYYLGSAQQLTGDYDGALRALDSWRATPIAGSPLAGKLSLLYARVLLDKHDPAATAKALEVLQTDYKTLPQPDGDFALGLAYEAQGEKQQSALSYERAFYEYPNTPLAAEAWNAMDRLRTALGKDFPEAPARQKLDRCEKWLAAKQYGKARQEYLALADSLTGPEREEAKIGLAVTDYSSGEAAAAVRALKDLKVAQPEIDAERLFYLTEATRRTSNDAEMMAAVIELGEKYPKSVWRLKALLGAGNRYLVTNDRAQYTPLYAAAFEAFPPDSSTAYAHWKVVWDAYLENRGDVEKLLRAQVDQYPDESHAGTALYFLGRIAERAGKPGEAHAYYDQLNLQFPHYYYGVLARERLADAEIAKAKPDDTVTASLATVNWPTRTDFAVAEPNAATRARIERIRLLQSAGLPDAAEAESRFGSKQGTEQPHLLALELARTAPTPFRALRIMKSYSGDYLSLPTGNAEPGFWQMLFPLPYKQDVFVNAQVHELDPFYVAALIRQESEFNPAAHSPANAFGLMQLIPSTGRLAGKQAGMKTVRSSMLLNPSINIRLGTQYLRGQLDNWGGDWVKTLAAYNAGPNHVKQWLTWSNYREPAEFIESIPFTETREYVQAVLRNAAMYKEIYSGKPIPTIATPVAAPVKPAVPKTASATKPPAKPVVKPVARKTALRKTSKKTVATKSAATHAHAGI